MESTTGGRKVRQEDDTLRLDLEKLTEEMGWSIADAKAVLKQRPNLDSAVQLLLRWSDLRQTIGTSHDDEVRGKNDGRPSRCNDGTSAHIDSNEEQEYGQGGGGAEVDRDGVSIECIGCHDNLDATKRGVKYFQCKQTSCNSPMVYCAECYTAQVNVMRESSVKCPVCHHPSKVIFLFKIKE